MRRNLMIHCLLVISLGTVLSGCGSGEQGVVPVSGMLTRNGKPVPNMEIYFLPVQGRSSVGMSDEQGRFKLGYTADTEGALVGRHTVFVAFNPPAGMGFAPPADLAQITSKYGSQDVSPLKIEITEAVDDLEIKLD